MHCNKRPLLGILRAVRRSCDIASIMHACSCDVKSRAYAHPEDLSVVDMVKRGLGLSIQAIVINLGIIYPSTVSSTSIQTRRSKFKVHVS